MKKDFSIRESYREARAIIKPRFWSVIGEYLLLNIVLSLVLSIILGKAAGLGSLITMYVTYKWSLSYASKKEFKFDNLFEGLTLKRFVYYIFTILLIGFYFALYPVIGMLILAPISLIVHAGFVIPVTVFVILMIYPGMLYVLRYYFALYIIIEKNVTPREALRESRNLTDGIKGKLLLTAIVGILVTILGVLCLIVGAFYAAPLVAIVSAVIYKKVSGSTLVAEPVVEEIIVETVEVAPAE